MDTVYIVGIVAAAIVILAIVIILRKRITNIEGGVSFKTKEIKGKVSAIPSTPDQDEPPSHAVTPEGIRENIQVGNPIIRVLRNVRVFRNLQIGRGRIEVTDEVRSEEEGSNG